jgi:SAM-dependent methyltransferase
MNIRAVDNLAPIRNQINSLVSSNSRVIELGCGDGDLLFKLAPKIKSGLGIDKSESLIGSAIKQKQRNNFHNIDFIREELGEDYMPCGIWDVSLASLFFHVIRTSDAVFLLNKLKELSNEIIICAICSPATFNQALLLWFDQRFSTIIKISFPIKSLATWRAF